MNKRALKELIGHIVKIRPAVRRLGPDGQAFPSIDDDWDVHPASGPNAVLHLRNQATGHFVDVGSDNVFEFRAPNVLVLKEQLSLQGNHVHRDPLPDPRARYTSPVRRSR